MSPIDWALRPLNRYFDFDGRSPRSEYWWFQLFQWIAYLVLGVIFGMIGGAFGGSDAGFLTAMILVLLLMIAFLLPNLAAMVRRLHDQDLSGWLCLLFFNPYVGGLICVVFMCIRGTQGPNRFGPDPFVEDHLERVFA